MQIHPLLSVPNNDSTPHIKKSTLQIKLQSYILFDKQSLSAIHNMDT